MTDQQSRPAEIAPTTPTGTRRRAVVLGASAAAAVAVLAICVPIALHGTDTDAAPAPAIPSIRGSSSPSNNPTSIADLPLGAPPRVAYLDKRTLYAGGQVFVVGRLTNIVATGPTVFVGSWAGKGVTPTWETLRDGRLVAVPFLAGRLPVLAPDGARFVVATNPTPQTSRVAVYDASNDAEIAHVDLDLPATCCDGGSIQNLGIDASGTVYWTEEIDGAPQVAWRPGSAPVRIRYGRGVKPATFLDGVTPAGPVLPQGSDDVLGTVGDDGTFTPVRRLFFNDQTTGAAWSPDGHLVTFADASDDPVAMDLATGRRTRLSLPASADLVGWVGFEDSTHVLLQVTDGDQPAARLVRCPTDGSLCERTSTQSSAHWGFGIGSD